MFFQFLVLLLGAITPLFQQGLFFYVTPNKYICSARNSTVGNPQRKTMQNMKKRTNDEKCMKKEQGQMMK